MGSFASEREILEFDSKKLNDGRHDIKAEVEKPPSSMEKEPWKNRI